VTDWTLSSVLGDQGYDDWSGRAAELEAELGVLRGRCDNLEAALELCNGEDIRLNGCVCKPDAPCYLHGVVVEKALGLSVSEVSTGGALAGSGEGQPNG
jgi:hypothetical protein